VVVEQERSSRGARERILAAAYELFSRKGVRAVGIDEIIVRSGVARMTLYRHFASKEDLALAFLERREDIWTRGWLKNEVERGASDPREQLLLIFDVFGAWFRSPTFEGCSFINVMLENSDPLDALHQASVDHLTVIRSFLEDLARRAGVKNVEDFARKWHLLMKGAIVAATEGDLDAAGRAREIGAILLGQESGAGID
jgi:AcrR family transcriptional regulator